LLDIMSSEGIDFEHETTKVRLHSPCSFL
jgi:hypothetical protein